MLYKSANTLIVLFIISLFFSSCSLIKSTDFSNFKRVKYNPNLASVKKEKIEKTTVWMDTTEQKSVSVESKLMASRAFKVSSNPSKFDDKLPKVNSTRNTIEIVLNEKTIESREASKKLGHHLPIMAPSSENKYWWESDIEDWPWKQIVLVIIAILIISIIVTLLVNIIGGLLSGLFGLILLLLLVYFLIGAWT